MVFHENRLLADDSHGMSYIFFFENKERCSKTCVSAAVVIGALRVNILARYSLYGIGVGNPGK